MKMAFKTKPFEINIITQSLYEIDDTNGSNYKMWQMGRGQVWVPEGQYLPFLKVRFEI